MSPTRVIASRGAAWRSIVPTPGSRLDCRVATLLAMTPFVVIARNGIEVAAAPAEP
jgi:hypothetical protein